MKVIKKDNKRIAIKIDFESVNDGLTFFSDDNDYLQVGAWKYERGKKLLAHNHNCVDRKVDRTQEFIFVLHGSLKAYLYDDKDELIEEVVLNSKEGLILLSGGHGYEISSDDTVVFEVKNGPYVGAQRDRRRLEV